MRNFLFPFYSRIISLAYREEVGGLSEQTLLNILATIPHDILTHKLGKIPVLITLLKSRYGDGRKSVPVWKPVSS